MSWWSRWRPGCRRWRSSPALRPSWFPCTCLPLHGDTSSGHHPITVGPHLPILSFHSPSSSTGHHCSALIWNSPLPISQTCFLTLALGTRDRCRNLWSVLPVADGLPALSAQLRLSATGLRVEVYTTPHVAPNRSGGSGVGTVAAARKCRTCPQPARNVDQSCRTQPRIARQQQVELGTLGPIDSVAVIS